MRILVNDFIGGALDRGIPLYVRNLVDGLREEGFHVDVVRAPAFCRKLPRGLLYLVAVLVEQMALPAIGLWRRADMTIYPYNSVALADLITGRGRIVVHDLEQLNRALSFSKLYYLACYRAVKWRNAPIFTISDISRLRLIRSGLFGHGPVTILPNTFYQFERLLLAEAAARKPAILLCSGSTANKDLRSLVTEYLPKALARNYRISIFGLHKKSDLELLEPLRSSVTSGQLRVCGRLSDRQVACEYRSHSLIWVHSLREGFGRCVVEGRLAGGRVVASDIPEFAGLRDGDVHLYRSVDEFLTFAERLVGMDAPAARYEGYPYRELLREAVARALPIRKARSAPQSPPAISVRSGTAPPTRPPTQNP